MSFNGLKNFDHGQAGRIGVLITNLGTPQAPTAKALKPYLKEFLSDGRVVEFPKLLWQIILRGIILNVRPKKSAANYAKVWTDEGSPLMVYTQAQQQALKTALQNQYGDQVQVEFAMRYGQPSIQDVIDKMARSGMRKLIVLPLYPQYSGSTSGSTFDAIARDFMKRRWLPDFRFISHYHDHPAYIEAMKQQIEQHWQQHGRADKLILSYHGTPKHYLLEGDPYFCECHKTSRLLTQALGLNDDQVLTTFQSRFGKTEWLKPYTDATLQALPEQGVKSVEVFCPGFSSDCLETLEEINEENRDYFMEAGGQTFGYIPCLNDSQQHVQMMQTLIEQQAGDWLNLSADALRIADHRVAPVEATMK